MADLGAVYNDSLTGCDTSGASAVFRFHGTGVSVMGTVSPTDGGDAAVSLYSVDGDNPTFFTTPRVNERTDAVQFFASGPLPLGDHVLIINVTAASRAAPYYLDYLQYTIDTLPIPSSSTSPATKSAPLVIHLLSQRTLASSPTASVFAAETKHTAPVGAVVGGVVGGLALIFVLIALLHWKHKRHPASEFEYGTQAQQGVPTLPPPYGVTAPAPSPVSTSTVV
ncbi:hypothetical protein PYCCODRAFT_1436134 [Trametes coccinea BRFM310]|uniref:Uncharacterized protein n=1 Tax=Trametes coccinea (strain BRFM310) TaxID=1353009 RepID=A0A1Y2IK50_TRAC3|nr:hypothetical protein PYCCODRAFT_1436134 [Trametes coccinea BRFM310]